MYVYALGLDFLKRGNSIVRIQPVSLDGDSEQDKPREMIHVFVRFARLHSRQQAEDDRFVVLLQVHTTQI